MFAMLNRDKKKDKKPKKRDLEIEAIKSDPEKQKKSKKFGLIGIAMCLLSLVLVYPMCFGAVALIKFSISRVIFAFIGNVFLFILGLAIPMWYVILQIKLFSWPISQLRVRHDWFGWFCLILTIATIIAVFFLCFASTGHIVNKLKI